MQVNVTANVQLLQCEFGERNREPCPQIEARLGEIGGGVKGLSHS